MVLVLITLSITYHTFQSPYSHAYIEKQDHEPQNHRSLYEIGTDAISHFL